MPAPSPDRLGLRPVVLDAAEFNITRRLPNRRQALRTKSVFTDPNDGAEFKLYITVGIDPADGKPAEIFIRSGGKAGKNSMLHRVLDAGAVLVSKLLQRGLRLEEIAAALGTETPLAEAVRIAAALEKEIDTWPEAAARLEA
jgi:hypothetical protein